MTFCPWCDRFQPGGVRCDLAAPDGHGCGGWVCGGCGQCRARASVWHRPPNLDQWAVA